MSHTFEPLRHAAKCQNIVSGRIVPDGTDDPTELFGAYFTVEHTGTGVYKVTLSEDLHFSSFNSIILTGQYENDDTDLHVLQLGAVNPATRSFEVLHLATDDTAATHPELANLTANGTAVSIHFLASLCYEEIPGSGHRAEVAAT
jgi:hypothetical protein